MSKTHKPNSRHNKYADDICNMNVRITVELKRKLEVAAKSHGVTLVDFVRMAYGKAVKDVVLTSADYLIIAERVKRNEENNSKRGK